MRGPIAVLTTLAVVLFLAAAAPVDAAGPLRTGFNDTGEFENFAGPDASVAANRMRALGATTVRTALLWQVVSPASPASDSDASDPNNPAYDWSQYDARFSFLKRQGLEPVPFFYAAPEWAGGNLKPDIEQLGAFAKAAARHFSGNVQGAPRIRYWQVWNEPNASIYLNPTKAGAATIAPYYRRMVNAVADGVHAVHRDNAVITGGLSPFTRKFANFVAIGPLQFMRQMLCMSAGAKPRPTCDAQAKFDIWSTHPYTSGGPTHHAANPNDVSLGDLPKMRKLLDASVKAGHVSSQSRVRFWVTEFSWDTRPPDPGAVPMWLHARWVSQALYEMWKVGIDNVQWLQLTDGPIPGSFNQGGFYALTGNGPASKPKLSAQAYRFPFVALRKRARGGWQARVWGRTPAGTPGTVVVEQTFRGGWKRVTTLRANRYGIFNRVVKLSSGAGSLRARLVRDVTVPFRLKPVADRYYLPFGTE